MLGYFHGCGHILPADFTQELSEYEILCKLLEETKSLKDRIEVVLNTALSYTDTKYNEAVKLINNLEDMLTKEIDSLEGRLMEQIEDAEQNAILQSKQYTDEQVQKARLYLKSLIEIVKNTITQQMIDLEYKVQQLDEAQRLWVLSEINKMWIKIEGLGKTLIIKDPMTGQLNNIQDVINQLWGLTNRGGITCGEYDALGLTCGEYDDKNITCYQYDTQARKRLMKDYRFIVYQPESGLQVNYKQVISWLTGLHQNDCLTCGEYDDKDLTCEQYDQLSISCNTYDWDSVNAVTT